MISTIRSSINNDDSLENMNPLSADRPLKPSVLATSSSMPNALPSIIIKKRSTRKRVRFASTLESVEEEVTPIAQESSTSSAISANKQPMDPWRQNGPLFGAYVEYLERQNRVTSAEKKVHRAPSPLPPAILPSSLLPESSIKPTTYTHTFVIQTKSPDLVIDSITISKPSHQLQNLPRIVQSTKKGTKHPVPLLDSYIAQRFKATPPPPRLTAYSKKLTAAPNHKVNDASTQTNTLQTSLSTSATSILPDLQRVTRSENFPRPKSTTNNVQEKRETDILTKPLYSPNNKMYHFSEHPILPNYSKKPNTPASTQRAKDKPIPKISSFFETYNNDHWSQPIIHSTH